MPHSTYLPERMGTAIISPTGAFEAGSYQSFSLVYTAGYFGIDDTGSIKIVHRFASDMGRPQWSDPQAANYTTVEASNGAVLDVIYDPKLNIRPWDKTLLIRVTRGFLREGDTITVRFGDRRQGSPGMRAQTFVEPTFEFRVLVDAIATCDYVELPVQPTIAIVSGPPATWKAVLPTLRRCGERFSMPSPWGLLRPLRLRPMLKPLRRASPDRVNKCMRKRASAKPVCAAAISASSLGWRSSVSVMRSDYRRYWNRATAGYRDAGRRPPLAYKAIRAKIRSESVREPLNRTARNA